MKNRSMKKWRIASNSISISRKTKYFGKTELKKRKKEKRKKKKDCPKDGIS